MPQLRQDPLTNTWVIIATERGKRPSDFAEDKKEKAEHGNCPFCLGNEHMTPPEITAIREDGAESDGKGWEIRVIPNKFPALKNEGNVEKHKNGLYETMDGVGAHEVIIEAADHNQDIHLQTEEHILKVLKIWRERVKGTWAMRGWSILSCLKTFGSVAGHPLPILQIKIISTPLVPENILVEMENMERFHRENKKCLLCEMVTTELEQQVRVVAENEDFLSFCPHASRFPFETWIIPRKHEKHFADVNDETLEGLSNVLKQTLNGLAQLLNEPPQSHGAYRTL